MIDWALSANSSIVFFFLEESAVCVVAVLFLVASFFNSWEVVVFFEAVFGRVNVAGIRFLF